MVKRSQGQPRRPYTRDPDTADKLLNAAEAVFLRRGTAAARTQEIADEAGVNKALLHYYYGDKESLAAEVFRRAFSQIFPRFFATLNAPDPLRVKLTVLVELYTTFLAERPFLIGYVVAELHAHPERLQQLLPNQGKVAFAGLQAQLEREVTAGNIRPIAIEEFIVNLLGLMVYPFIARPILARVFQMDDAAFAAFLDERKRTLPEFFLNALRP